MNSEDNFIITSLINVGLLTPKDFMEIFPITKDFKGHMGVKITYTRNYINTLNLESLGGEEEV